MSDSSQPNDKARPLQFLRHEAIAVLAVCLIFLGWGGFEYWSKSRRQPLSSLKLDGVRLNFHSVTKSELGSLPGLGSRRAQKIIELRDEGKIRTIDDLKKHAGLQERLIGQLERHLKFESSE